MVKGRAGETINSSLSTDDSTSDITTADQSGRCCKFPPSAYPVYLANVFHYVPIEISKLMVLDTVIYNKLCFMKYKNISLCTNSTFTTNHPALQVFLVFLIEFI